MTHPSLGTLPQIIKIESSSAKINNLIAVVGEFNCKPGTNPQACGASGIGNRCYIEVIYTVQLAPAFGEAQPRDGLHE